MTGRHVEPDRAGDVRRQIVVASQVAAVGVEVSADVEHPHVGVVEGLGQPVGRHDELGMRWHDP